MDYPIITIIFMLHLRYSCYNKHLYRYSFIDMQLVSKIDLCTSILLRNLYLLLIYPKLFATLISMFRPSFWSTLFYSFFRQIWYFSAIFIFDFCLSDVTGTCQLIAGQDQLMTADSGWRVFRVLTVSSILKALPFSCKSLARAMLVYIT